MSSSSETHSENNRIQSVDIVRGLIMIIMALDHVREYYSYTAFRATDVTQTSVPLFFTRWATHLCAPTFVFLSGISIFLSRRKVGNLAKTSVFLITRGVWLIAVEVLLISFILTQGYQLTLLEVIWTIGCSMILLAGLIWLPRWAQVLLSLTLIVGHDAIPTIMTVAPANMPFAFLHNTPFFINHPPILVAYTIVPWVGVMLLGYAIGSWFTYARVQTNRLLLQSGVLAISLFIVLRWLNVYGDPAPWATQSRGSVYTFLSFVNVSKSPPSLLFLCITLGTACLLLALANSIPVRVNRFLMVYGRVPFFFFILHLALISFSAYTWTYLSFGKGINLSFMPSKDWPPEYHPNLWRVYFVWLTVIALLYLPCRWYGKYKLKSKSWWTSYL